MYLQDALLMLVAVTGVVALALLYWQHGILNALRLTGAAAQMAGALFPYIVVLSAFVYVGDALSAAVVGFGRTDLVSRAHVAARVAAIAVTFALLYRKVGVPSLLIGLAIQYAIPGAFCSLWLLRFLGRDRALIWRGSLSSSKVLLRLGVGLATYSTVPILIHPLNKLVLGRICGVSTVPIYEVSYTAVVTLKALIEGTLKPLIPEISRLSGSSPWNSEPALRRLRTRTIAFLLALVAPGCAIVFFLAPFLLQIWLRSRFTPAMVPTFRILLVGFGLGFAALPRIQELIGLGDVRQLVIASGIQLVANIGLLVLLNSVATITLTRLAVAAATGPAVAALFLLLAGNLAKGRHGGAANAPYTVRTEMSLAETGE
jgi:O-antigen/teichoic acid export membrane protein